MPIFVLRTSMYITYKILPLAFQKQAHPNLAALMTRSRVCQRPWSKNWFSKASICDLFSVSFRAKTITFPKVPKVSWLLSNHSIKFWFLYYAYPHSCCAPHIEAVAWPQEATSLNLQCSNVFWLMSNHSIKFWLLYYEYPHSCCTPHTAISIHPYNWTGIFWGNSFFAISQKVLKLEG